VIGDLSLSLREGEIVSIVGPSGCGKTTLLNTLCGLLAPDSGRIRWHGREVSGQPQNVGYMLQKDLLLPWRTAIGNTMLGLEIRGVAPAEARERSHAMLDRLGLLSKRPTMVKAVYDIDLGEDRTDMMAMRQSPGFSQYVRRIWADLDVVLQ
jgi:ABC-type nitrate/sulfonate/bicarbonate transport system ATPase subunit